METRLYCETTFYFSQSDLRSFLWFSVLKQIDSRLIKLAIVTISKKRPNTDHVTVATRGLFRMSTPLTVKE